jgi:hypothetical protein
MSIPPDWPQILDLFDTDVPLGTLNGGDGIGNLFERATAPPRPSLPSDPPMLFASNAFLYVE